jgi:predicted ATPase
VELRLDRLPGAARGLLRAAAGAGRTFDVATVAKRAEAPPAATRDAMRAAMRTGLVVADVRHPERFTFRHGLVRHALLTP